jgi:5-bromo-4-chloroindolyl phosphate hydrolysis protein
LIWRGKWVEVAAPEPAFVSTGNAELDELVRQGHEAIGQMRQLNSKIKDEKLSGQIDRLESLTDNIFKHVAKNPGKISQIRKFMNYYLPTTLKLLTSYAELAAQGVQGKNITATMTKIETIMDTIVVAFEKQLDSLFSSDALDISTDITVLEGMLQREGLTVQAMRMDK